MADDPKNPGAQHRNQVNINEDHEVRYWTQKWGITKRLSRNSGKGLESRQIRGI
jgi:hypothetical protein